jgi:hypothetical protein
MTLRAHPRTREITGAHVIKASNSVSTFTDPHRISDELLADRNRKIA